MHKVSSKSASSALADNQVSFYSTFPPAQEEIFQKLLCPIIALPDRETRVGIASAVRFDEGERHEHQILDGGRGRIPKSGRRGGIPRVQPRLVCSPQQARPEASGAYVLLLERSAAIMEIDLSCQGHPRRTVCPRKGRSGHSRTGRDQAFRRLRCDPGARPRRAGGRVRRFAGPQRCRKIDVYRLPLRRRSAQRWRPAKFLVTIPRSSRAASSNASASCRRRTLSMKS